MYCNNVLVKKINILDTLYKTKDKNVQTITFDKNVNDTLINKSVD